MSFSGLTESFIVRAESLRWISQLVMPISWQQECMMAPLPSIMCRPQNRHPSSTAGGAVSIPSFDQQQEVTRGFSVVLIWCKMMCIQLGQQYKQTSETSKIIHSVELCNLLGNLSEIQPIIYSLYSEDSFMRLVNHISFCM